MGIFKRKGKLFSKLAIKTNMWNNRDKIIKKDGKKPTDLEEEVAKSIQKVENNNKGLKAYLSIIFINSVANVDYRTIVSPSAKQHTSQMRPRSRCLTVVHKEILNDVCFPSHIAGRSVRVSIDGHRHQRVFLDPLDREIMDNR